MPVRECGVASTASDQHQALPQRQHNENNIQGRKPKCQKDAETMNSMTASEKINSMITLTHESAHKSSLAELYGTTILQELSRIINHHEIIKTIDFIS
jgi:hypothetical protein